MSATTLQSRQPGWGQPNITGNCRNWERNSHLLCTSWSNYNTVCMPPWNTALGPFSCVRAADGSAETTDVASIILLMFPDIRSSPCSRIVAVFGRASDAIPDWNSIFLLSAHLASTFFLYERGLGRKHAGLRSWKEARWDWSLRLKLSLIASWFYFGAEELLAPMASVSKVSILDYFNIVFEGENGKIESNCKACGTRIQAKRSVTSNFVTHLKVNAFKMKWIVSLLTWGEDMSTRFLAFVISLPSSPETAGPTASFSCRL